MFCVQHTPLMLACTKGKPEVVKVLLLHGADVTQREGEEGQETLNSLELAIENSRRYVHVLMRDEKEGRKKQTNNKAKQHSTPDLEAVTFPELPRMGLELRLDGT